MRRTSVLAGILVAATVLTALVLAEVLLVVFFALTVAYVSRPLYRWLRRQGVQRHLASGITTATVFLVVVLLLLPVGAVLYAERNLLIGLVDSLPESVSVGVAGFGYTVQAGEVWDPLADWLQDVALGVANEVPRMTLEFLLFTVVLFGVLLGSTRTANAIHGVVPEDYHDVLQAFHVRVEDTLRAIYLVQLATAVVTGLLGLVVFYALGYDQFLMLAVLSGVLQFLPIVGPSVVIVALAGAEALAGDYVAAVLVLVAAGVVVAALPDFVLRPQLASSLADIPATLYFVGFFGGVLTLGIYGAVVGPLVLAVLVEAVGLLSAEQRSKRSGATAAGDPNAGE